MQTATNKTMNSLEKRISTIEDSIKKPVVQQNVTTRYEERNNPYSDIIKQQLISTERKPRAEGAESYRSNNSTDFEMVSNVI